MRLNTPSAMFYRVSTILSPGTQPRQPADAVPVNFKIVVQHGIGNPTANILSRNLSSYFFRGRSSPL